MKNLLFAGLLLLSSSSFAETIYCPPRGIISINENTATLINWGSEGTQISNATVMRDQDLIVINLGGGGANTIYLTRLSKRVYKYDYITYDQNRNDKCFLRTVIFPNRQ